MSVLRELAAIADEVVGVAVRRPSGQLAGHAGGLPFEKVVHFKIKARYSGRAFRHFEALNVALAAEQSLSHWTQPPAGFVFGPPDVHFLVHRGVSAMRKWRITSLFEEKQNDTAESIIFADEQAMFRSNLVSLIDVKTQNISKAAQPPNIISAVKMANLAEIVLSEGLTPRFEILYAGVKFEPAALDGVPSLVCRDATAIDLMKIPPREIYINWAAATQIQFHPFAVSQAYLGTPRQWLIDYLDQFCTQLESRLAKESAMVARFREVLVALPACQSSATD